MKPLSLLPLLALAGCVAAPATPPRPAPITAPVAFAAAQGAQGAQQADLAHWWRAWGDPALDSLVEQALAANADLRAARAHVAAARALVSIAEGALYPTIAAQGAVWTGYSDASADGLLGASFAPYVSTGNAQARTVSLGASWEPDLFGARHADVAAARALYDSADFTAQGLRLIVAGDVVENYQQLQGLRQRLALLDRSIATAQGLADYAAARMDAGQANVGDVAKARAAAEQLAAARAPLLALIDTRQRRLAVLAGLTPEQAVAISPPERLIIPAAPGGQVPSVLLTRRPDVQARAALVRMQAARLKSLKADLLPRFGIHFIGQSGTLELSGLPGYGGNNALIGLTASVPIFTGGRLRARVVAGDAELTAALAEQDKALLQALEEVEAAYAFRSALDTRNAGLARAAALASQRAAQQWAFFRSSRATKGDALQADLAAIEAQDTLAQARIARASATVQLLRALGGGWDAPAPE